MAYSAPIADRVTTTLSGAITGTATSATIGTGLNLPATNGILQIDYDSATAVGSDNGPETISYATYVTGTGAITGLVRGLAYTTNGTPGVGVAHANSAHVMCGPSVLYLQQSPQYDTWNAAGTLTYGTVDGPTQTATISGDSTSSIYPGVRLKYTQSQALQNYWSFDTNNADAIAGISMTNIGTPTYTAGKFSNALTLNGSSQALQVGSDTAASNTTMQLGLNGAEFSIGCWFKTSNTGAGKVIFQNYAKNTNFYGIYLTVETSNKLSFNTASNASAQSSILGTTTVTDGNWHYCVVSFRNNYAQMYLDSVLEASGYLPNPSYNTTSYCRIGCYNEAASNLLWFNGQIDDLFIMTYALDEQTIAAQYALTAAQGTGNITVQKYALVTKSSYSNPTTTVTIYSGTDHTLANATISNAYYSTQKAPYGFPLNPKKWEVQIETGSVGQGSPTAFQSYNLGGSIPVPIGLWKIYYSCEGYVQRSSNGDINFRTSMSTTNNGTTEYQDLSGEIRSASSGTGTVVIGGMITKEAFRKINAKTTYYLNASTDGSGQTQIGLGDYLNSVIRATSTLL